MIDVLKEEDKARHLVSIVTKRSFSNGKFDSFFGVGITVRNFLSGIFDSYAHTELDFLDDWSWSASESLDRLDMNGKKAGVGFKAIEYSHPERWVRTNIDVRDPRLKIRYKNVFELKEKCIKYTGRDYDLIGCFGQAINIKEVEDRTKFFCSEAVGYVFGFPSLSPAKLQKEIERLFKRSKT